MKSVKRMLVAGVLGSAVLLIAPAQPLRAEAPAAASKITEDQLGPMIASLGLEPEKKQQRFDFLFQTDVDKDQWVLSMSAVLSQDGESIWIMAWLDELPQSEAGVAKALLKLLAQNDQLGNGKFFAYIPANRRFVLQRSFPNRDVTSAQLRLMLQDLGATVIETYPIWHSANWNPTGIPASPVGQPAAGVPTQSQSALNDPKFDQPVRR